MIQNFDSVLLPKWQPKDCSPKGICGPNTQSETVGLTISGAHTKKVSVILTIFVLLS